MATPSKPRSVTSPGSPDDISDPAKKERANSDGTPVELPTTTPSVPITPAPTPPKKLD
ncbi:hypothetical protein [Polaromonas sp.]|uniref:hypothetical protein n=1 Tax=Polaromonas sp. TaxID=1869339 RepID=UPI003529DE29